MYLLLFLMASIANMFESFYIQNAEGAFRVVVFIIENVISDQNSKLG